MALLAKELVDRGVPTTIIAGHMFAGHARSSGARVVAVGPTDYAATPARDGAPAEASSTTRSMLRGFGRGPRQQTRSVVAWMRTIVDPLATALLDVVAPGDVVVGGLLSLDDLCALRDARDCRPMLALFAPIHPTADGAATLLPVRPRASSVANVWTGKLALSASYELCTQSGRVLRARLGLPRTTRRGFVASLGEVPVLHATTRALVPVPRGTSEVPIWQTGVWRRPDRTGDPQPGDGLPAGVSEDLARFVDDGAPPVLLGFGSMPSLDPSAVVTLMSEAARGAGRRAVVLRPLGIGGGAEVGLIAPDVFVVDQAPHEWLMPRTAAVVHHGGAGTTARSLLSGVPSMAVTFGADQPYYGRRLCEIEAGPAPIPRKGLTTTRLAAAIREMTTAPGADIFRAGAARARVQMLLEPGVTAAADKVIGVHKGSPTAA
jgi:UDP:flavonoid glycosyltransferase YjiC (YdhE family)